MDLYLYCYVLTFGWLALNKYKSNLWPKKMWKVYNFSKDIIMMSFPILNLFLYEFGFWSFTGLACFDSFTISLSLVKTCHPCSFTVTPASLDSYLCFYDLTLVSETSNHKGKGKSQRSLGLTLLLLSHSQSLLSD